MTIIPTYLKPLAVVVMLLLFQVLTANWAQAQEAYIRDLTVVPNQENLVLGCRLENAFTEDLEEMILSGLQASFIFQVGIFRGRMFWPDKEITSFELKHTITYDHLKDEFTVSFSEVGREPVVVKKFAEARKLMTELTDLPVLVLNRLEPRRNYYAKVKAILGLPDWVDRENDLYIKNQDTSWTYKHPVLESIRFLVIFRDDRVELAVLAVRDDEGISHYFGKRDLIDSSRF